MSKILTTTTAIVVLGLTAMGAAHARAIDHNHHYYYVNLGYAVPVNPSAARVLWPWYVPSHGIVGESCGHAFQPMCK